MDNILLPTKLRRPRVPRDLVARPHLIARLNAHPERGLTLLSAPAGSGKSTLLAEWLDTQTQPVAWLSLDKDDNDLARFLQYTVHALRVIFPDACSRTLVLLSGSETPPVRVLAGAFISETDELAGRVILVLDDLHRISNKAVLEFLSIWIQNEPLKLHLVLATRHDPVLPLMHSRAAGDLVELRGADLRFSLQETQEFLAKNFQAGAADSMLDAQWAARLNDELEGWAAGLRLAALSMRDSSDLAARSLALGAEHRLAQEYLVDEVLARQKNNLRRLLFHLSCVDRFCLSLARALMADTPAAPLVDALFDELVHANLFLISLDNQAQWFRFHHLFQELLLERLAREITPEQLTALQLRASAWFEQQGWVEEAIEYALKANDPERAAQLIETHAPAYFNRQEWRIVEQWLGQIPEHLFDRRPLLRMVRAWIWSIQWRPDSIRTVTNELEPQLERNEFGLDAANERLVRSYLYALRAMSDFLATDSEKAVQSGQTALELAPPDYRFLRGNALFWVALALQAVGKKQQGLALLRREQSLEGNQVDEFTARLYYAQYLVHEFENELVPAERAIRYLDEVASGGNLLDTRVWTNAGLGRICYEQNRLPQALEHYAATMEIRFSANRSVAISCCFGLALVYQALGRADQADESAANARLLALDAHSPFLVEWCTAFEGHLALLRGDLERAVALTHGLAAEPQPRAWIHFYIPEITTPAVWIAQGTSDSLQDAERYLDRLEQICARNHAKKHLARLLVLRALLARTHGHEVQALQTLERAVELARPGELVRTFVDHGKPMNELFAEFAGRRPDDAYVHKILDAFSIRESPLAPPTQPLRAAGTAAPVLLPEMLTDRELQVLQLLQSRLSNKEIAQQLTISLFTVQTHTSNIYAKLGVSGRRPAVEAAVKLGLLAAVPAAF